MVAPERSSEGARAIAPPELILPGDGNAEKQAMELAKGAPRGEAAEEQQVREYCRPSYGVGAAGASTGAVDLPKPRYFFVLFIQRIVARSLDRLYRL